MNKILASLTLVSALSAAPLFAKDGEAKAPKEPKAGKVAKSALNIEERLEEVDLSVTLQQYENVRRLEQDVALEAALLDVGAEATDQARKQLAVRRNALREHAEKLRGNAIDLAGKLRARRENASDAKR